MLRDEVKEAGFNAGGISRYQNHTGTWFFDWLEARIAVEGAKGQLRTAQESRGEYDEHFYGYDEKLVDEFSHTLEPNSLDPNGLQECLDVLLSKARAKLDATRQRLKELEAR